MNARDYKYLKEKTYDAEKSIKLYNDLNAISDSGIEYNKEVQFWRGTLNALNLLWLNAKNFYKFDS